MSILSQAEGGTEKPTLTPLPHVGQGPGWAKRGFQTTALLIPPLLPLSPPPVGSQDSLLEITFRSGALPVLCDPTTPKPEDLHSPPLGAGLADFAHPAGSPLGRRDCLVKLECFRFLPPEDTPPPAQGQPLLGSLELIKFRESGIASGYESNTDESEERDSWSQEELPRLLNVLQRQELGDSLDDEIAV